MSLFSELGKVPKWGDLQRLIVDTELFTIEIEIESK